MNLSSATITRFHLFVLFAALFLLAGCDALSPDPTLEAPVELISPTPPPTRRPSATPRPIHSPTPFATATITPTATPTIDPDDPTPTLADMPPAETLDPVIQTQVAANLTATLAPQEFLIGQSAEGRRITGHRIGRGVQAIVLVGGIHGGWEANTIELMNLVIDYFEDTPEEIAPGLSLVVIPALNPDGVSHGREIAGRFNANRVDLNRNWGCDWSETAYWQNQQVNPGAAPFSEPETAALADYILINQPTAVIFYHSNANGVFAGACNGDHGSQVLGHVYGEAAQYPHDGGFTAYEVTGDASSWVDGQGIPSITVELQSWTAPEWDRNYEGIMAIQCELTRNSASSSARQWAANYCDRVE